MVMAALSALRSRTERKAPGAGASGAAQMPVAEPQLAGVFHPVYTPGPECLQISSIRYLWDAHKYNSQYQCRRLFRQVQLPVSRALFRGLKGQFQADEGVVIVSGAADVAGLASLAN